MKSTELKKLRGRPSKEAQAEYEEHLLQVATEEFLQLGYAAATIDGIARKAGISKLTIYRRFEGKEGLFLTVAERAIRQESTFPGIPTADREPSEVLQAFARATYDSVTSAGSLALTRMAIASAQDFPDVAQRYYSGTLEALAPLASYLATLSKQGVLAISDPLQAALNFTNLSMGGVRFLVMQPLPGEERDIWCAEVTRLFMDGYRRRD